MDFDRATLVLNELLSKKQPTSFNSSWILREAPECYRFIRKTVRAEVGGVDWDRVTYSLNSVYQRRWIPGRRRRVPTPYANGDEVDRVLHRYQDKLYVFVALGDAGDKCLRDIISIALVRIAQDGNLSAKQELVKLVGYTIDDWIEHYPFLTPWLDYGDELRKQLEGCIRRYRYTGSFIRYVFRTLQYAARGLRPLRAYSLDEPLPSGNGRKGDLIGHNLDSSDGRYRLAHDRHSTLAYSAQVVLSGSRTN